MTDREAIAREIDPEAWAALDRNYGTTLRGRIVSISEAVKERHCKSSLAKADRILALLALSSVPVVPEGVVLVPVKATEAMLRAGAMEIAMNAQRITTAEDKANYVYRAMLEVLTLKGG